jgi:integrase
VGYAARLAALTGLRRDDLFRLSWPHVGEHAIEIKTAKGRGRRIAIVPLTQAAKALLAQTPRRGMAVLTKSSGSPGAVLARPGAPLWRRQGSRTEPSFS